MYIIPRYISAFVFTSARNLVRFRAFLMWGQPGLIRMFSATIVQRIPDS